MDFLDVNFLSIFIAALATMVIGAIWYSPLFLGKPWMELMKKGGNDLKEMEKGAKAAYAVHFVMNLVVAYVLVMFMKMTGVESVTEGMRLAFWVWLGFMLTNAIGASMWENRSKQLVAIEASYQLVTMAVMGGILAYWL